MGHSARRRHDLARMKKKALRVFPHMLTAKWANHLKGCSCAMCCNPRRSPLFSGDALLTIQERRHPTQPNQWREA